MDNAIAAGHEPGNLATISAIGVAEALAQFPFLQHG